ncbi:MAG: HEAT repeat domain-containing protein [Crocosphaera sp.]
MLNLYGYDFTNNKNQYVRITAIAQLGQQFKDDPDTVKILKSLAVDDERYDVRRTAIRLLKEEFANDSIELNP